jgi:photosystem II stability/assembly factor-like uncharacterized protein
MLRPLLPSALTRAIAVVASGLLLAACSGGSGSDTEQPTMAHIHGLGIDPADGTLYAGTHHGLFRIPKTGEPSLAGKHVQDFMGFAVVGKRHFLASGHPGPGQGGPPSVGLIESTDGGRSWKTLSLSGEADFHSLDSADGTIYGLNAHNGQLMASDDGRQWEVRSTTPMADFAADPAHPRTIVATTEEGPAISTDGGKSFTALDGAPLVALVDWAADGTLVGVAPDGTVYGGSDAGKSWKKRGRLAGPPEAIDVDNAHSIFAAANGKIWKSSDGGRTFSTYPRR